MGTDETPDGDWYRADNPNMSVLDLGIRRDSLVQTRNNYALFAELFNDVVIDEGYLRASRALATPEAIQRAREHYTWSPPRWVPPIEPVYDFVPLPPVESDDFLVGAIDPEEPEWHDAMRLDASSKAAADEIAAWDDLLGRSR